MYAISLGIPDKLLFWLKLYHVNNIDICKWGDEYVTGMVDHLNENLPFKQEDLGSSPASWYSGTFSPTSIYIICALTFVKAVQEVFLRQTLRYLQLFIIVR